MFVFQQLPPASRKLQVLDLNRVLLYRHLKSVEDKHILAIDLGPNWVVLRPSLVEFMLQVGKNI